MAYINNKKIYLSVMKGEKGDNGLCSPLASFILGGGSGRGYAVINTDLNKITFPNDTLIIGNKTYYRLASEKNNNEYTFDRNDLGGTSAVNIVYQISADAMLAKRFDAKINVNDEILLCSIRYTNEPAVSITCPYELIGGGITYIHRPRNNAFESLYLAPLIAGYSDKYIEVDSAAGTIKFPHDTLIVNPNRRDESDIITYQLSKDKGNNICNYLAATSSTAVKIYYDPSSDKLVASIYGYAPLSFGKYILIAVIRTSQKTVAANLPYIFDGLLNGVDYNEWVENYSNKNIRSVNHRGYCTEAPENTLSAFKLSKKKGFEYVECDVSFTKDNVPVVLHDDTIDRTSNGTGNIADLTFDEVRALDFGGWFSEDYTGEKIPSFEEFIVLCKRLGLKPYIEIKSIESAEQAGNLVKIVQRYDMLKNVAWISFNHLALEYVKQYDAAARLGLVVGEITEVNRAWVKQQKTDQNEIFIDAAYGMITSESINACAEDNIPVEVWTINDANAITTIDAYVSGFTSDNLIAGKVLYQNNI